MQISVVPDVRHEIEAAGRIAQRRKRKNVIAPDQAVSHRRKVYGRNFGPRVEEAGKSGADGENRLSKGARERWKGLGDAYTCPRWHFRDKVDS